MRRLCLQSSPFPNLSQNNMCLTFFYRYENEERLITVRKTERKINYCFVF